MNENQIELIIESFDRIEPVADSASMLFYQRLFELDPSLRDMFDDHMGEQQRKFIDTLRAAVLGIPYPESLVPLLHDLGKRHATYGVQPAHYATVGAALLWTLQQYLGEDYTPEVAAAWEAAYALIAETMQAGV
jgi:hemoglobin-like flavoprotein